MNDETKIAGLKNVSDWKILRKELIDNRESFEIWETAFNQFMLARINTRYFRFSHHPFD